MKKIYNIILIASVGTLFFIGCTKSPESVEPAVVKIKANAQNIILNIDVKEQCDINKNSIKDVLATAVSYNKSAVNEGVEFKRLGMTTTQYINGVTKALENGDKTIDIVNKKKKKTGTVSVSYATWRACSFAIRALQQKEEAKTTWKLAIPGDGYKY